MYGFYALNGEFAAIPRPFFYVIIFLSANPTQNPALVVQSHLIAVPVILAFFVLWLLLLLKVHHPVKGEVKVYLEHDISFTV